MEDFNLKKKQERSDVKYSRSFEGVNYFREYHYSYYKLQNATSNQLQGHVGQTGKCD